MASTSSDRRQGVNAGAAVKVPCRCATTASITLSGLQTIDGVTVVADDRVLVMEQTTGSENGIYVVSSSTWQRAKDWDGRFDVVQGTLVPVANGTVNGGQVFRVTTANPITIGTTSVDFTFALDAATLAFLQSGTAPTTRNIQDVNRAIVRSGDFALNANYLSRLAALTETIGVFGLNTTQVTEKTGVKILEHFPVTSGFAPFQVHYNSYDNPGGGAGTFNHATHIGYNVNRHSSTGTATSNKPALIMGFEDNYYDQGGDNQYGMEWYVEYFSPDGTSVQMLRPFYTRILSNDNSQNNAVIKFEVGTDGVGQFIVKTDSSHTLFQVSPSSSSTQVAYIKLTGAVSGSGPTIGALGETNTPLLITSNGAGRIDLMTGFTSRIQLRIADTASSVNYAQVTGGALGSGPVLTAQGSDTNVAFSLMSKGSGSVNIGTNGSTSQVTVSHTASAVNTVYLSGGATGVGCSIAALGEANAPLLVSSSGAGRIDFLSGFFSQVQFRITHTASASRFVSVTGSNGGNPTISTSAGNLAITPAVIVAAASGSAIGVATSASTALNLPAGTTGVSSIRLAHGSAPTSPVDGDMWTTTAGLFVRVNGSTVGPLS